PRRSSAARSTRCRSASARSPCCSTSRTSRCARSARSSASPRAASARSTRSSSARSSSSSQRTRSSSHLWAKGSPGPVDDRTEMSLEIGRSPPSAYYAPPVTPARSVDTATQGAKNDQRAHDVVVGDIPPAPPKEVRDQVDQAAEIAKKMAEDNPPRELHFSM